MEIDAAFGHRQRDAARAMQLWIAESGDSVSPQQRDQAIIEDDHAKRSQRPASARLHDDSDSDSYAWPTQFQLAALVGGLASNGGPGGGRTRWPKRRSHSGRPISARTE